MALSDSNRRAVASHELTDLQPGFPDAFECASCSKRTSYVVLNIRLSVGLCVACLWCLLEIVQYVGKMVDQRKRGFGAQIHALVITIANSNGRYACGSRSV